ncbi:MAG: caspase family protein [Deinococcota bacterium]
MNQHLANTSSYLPIRIVLLGVLLGLFVSTAYAGNRALLIGISEYQNSAINLRGPNTDLLLMQEVASRLGFSAAQTLTLRNAEADQASILSSLDRWLVEGVTSEDQVLLFFSGHGYQLLDDNGDEADGCDEAWLSHDMKPVSDDVLAEVLARSPAGRVLVIVDSCFSGTMTRSYQPNQTTPSQVTLSTNVLRSKLWRAAANLPCAPLAAEAGQLELATNAPNNVLALSAAAASELAYDALANNRGSVFTQALYEQVLRHDQEGLPLSLMSLQQLIAADIASTLQGLGYPPHVPQLSGPPAWLTADILRFGMLEAALVDSADANRASLTGPFGELSRYASELVPTRQFNVDVQTNAARYRINDPVTLQVSSPRAGYLYLLGQASDGSVYVVFPNQLAPDNSLQAATAVTIPGPGWPEFSLSATEPAGQNYLLAIVTDRPMQPLHQLETEDILARYTAAELASVRAWLNPLTTPPADQRPTYGLGQTLFDVVP